MISKSYLSLNVRTRESTYANCRMSCAMPSATAVKKRASRSLELLSMRLARSMRRKRDVERRDSES